MQFRYIEINKIIKKYVPYYKETFISSCVIGFLAHGFMMANKISYHDDIMCTSYGTFGANVTHGRWTTGIIQYFLRNTFGIYGNNWLRGIGTIILFSIAAVMVTGMFNLSRWTCILGAGVLMTFPYMISTFAYLFQGWVHGVAFLFIMIAMWIIVKNEKKKIWNYLIAIFLIACAVGVYQAYLCWAVVFLCFYTLFEIGNKNIKRVIIAGVVRVGVLLVSVILYAISNRFFLWVKGKQMSTYKNMDKAFVLTPQILIERISRAYQEFGKLILGNYSDWSESWLIRCVWIGNMLICLVIVLYGFFRICTNSLERVCWGGLWCLMPLAVNCICIMVDVNLPINSLMNYATSFWLIIPLCFIERFKEEKKIYRCWVVMNFLIMGIFISYYINYANGAYMKVYFGQQQANSYYTRLVSRIQNMEGYRGSYPVAFVFSGDGKNDILEDTLEIYKDITLVGYGTSNFYYSEYSMFNYMKMYCGFVPDYIEDTEALKKDKRVENMGTYPDDGSIVIIDNTVVVKMPETMQY